ncbi:uncharacterized protein [Cicer arietinum]|uniref:RING-type E3 ubiquitin transferase n=1 Tax=Cicer arietinum TaxID=3827 RepID=A0A1S3DY43_CICAR|nr:E3 ubiquitin-protein ligase MBR2-like [Cicer arietinum]
MNSQGGGNNHANSEDFEEQAPLVEPTVYAPDPELRSVIETRIQIALERQRLGQPLTFEDVMALDYEDALRHLNQQNQRQHEQQPQPQLEEEQIDNPILREEEIMNNIGREYFEPIDAESVQNMELCSICQVNYDIGDEIGRLDCAHKYHMSCITQWILRENRCPLCNRMGLYFN